MPGKPITIPKFRDAGQEADWWESREGKRAATELMKQAVATGQVRRRNVGRVVKPPINTD